MKSGLSASSRFALLVSPSVLGLPAGAALAPLVLPHRVLGGELMPGFAVRLASVDGREAASPQDVRPTWHRLQMVGCRRIPGGSYTGGIAAEVIYMEPWLNGAVSVDPCGSMSVAGGSLGGVGVSELPVPGVGVRRGDPHPARPQFRPFSRDGSIFAHLGEERLFGRGTLGQLVRAGTALALVMLRTNIKTAVRLIGAIRQRALLHDAQRTPREGVVSNFISTLGGCNA